MGQIETKLQSSVPAKYLEFAQDNTQLQPQAVQICWNFWRRDSRLRSRIIYLHLILYVKVRRWQTGSGRVLGFAWHFILLLRRWQVHGYRKMEMHKITSSPLFRDQQLFSLLDRDENGFIDFRDILVFLFSTEVSLSLEDARLRSFRFYDRSVLTWKERGFLELFLSSGLATRWSLRWRCSAH